MVAGILTQFGQTDGRPMSLLIIVMIANDTIYVREVFGLKWLVCWEQCIPKLRNNICIVSYRMRVFFTSILYVKKYANADVYKQTAFER